MYESLDIIPFHHLTIFIENSQWFFDGTQEEFIPIVTERLKQIMSSQPDIIFACGAVVRDIFYNLEEGEIELVGNNNEGTKKTIVCFVPHFCSRKDHWKFIAQALLYIYTHFNLSTFNRNYFKPAISFNQIKGNLKVDINSFYDLFKLANYKFIGDELWDETNQHHLKELFEADSSVSTIRDKLLLKHGVTATNKQIQSQLVNQGLKLKKAAENSKNVTSWSNQEVGIVKNVFRSPYKNKPSLAIKILSNYLDAIRTERSCKKQFNKDKSNKIGPIF